MYVRSCINKSAPSLVTVCVDRQEHGEFLGRLYTKLEWNPVTFHSTVDLAAKLENYFNEIRFPRSTLAAHSFFAATVPGGARTKNQRLGSVQEAERILEQRGDLATFVVHVQYRQNATWQGKIFWAEKQSEQSFRSALEMLRMMDQAIAQGQAVPESKQETDAPAR